MYQNFEIPFRYEDIEGIQIGVEPAEGHYVYNRTCGEETVEKLLTIDGGQIVLNPIEPLTKPKELTYYFQLKFVRNLIISPKATKTIFATFPIEIGVFLLEHSEYKLIDSFTLTRPKYTLYGDPRHGVICRYWKSDLYPNLPSLDMHKEGILELTITNDHTKWVEITQAVLNGYGMKIYYNHQKVTMKARMRIVREGQAETDFIDAPLDSDMKKSFEVYLLRKLSIANTKYIMELGL